jgi:hypothetical protein
MTCPGSGLEVFANDGGDVVCPCCHVLLFEDEDTFRGITLPQHQLATAASSPAPKPAPCLRCQALEAALEQAATKALEWRDAARLAAAIIDTEAL